MSYNSKNNSKSHFFAMMSRLKFINRWALMRNSREENLSEHSLDVAMISHVLCLIGNRYLSKNLNAEMAGIMGMYHDATEIITGDMPTPIKYYNNAIRNAYKDIENSAVHRLVSMLPEELRGDYNVILEQTDDHAYEKKLVKAADKLSALIKCIEEDKAGNNEFKSAMESSLKSINAMEIPEVSIFMDMFLDSYHKTLDELQ